MGRLSKYTPEFRREALELIQRDSRHPHPLTRERLTVPPIRLERPSGIGSRSAALA